MKFKFERTCPFVVVIRHNERVWQRVVAVFFKAFKQLRIIGICFFHILKRLRLGYKINAFYIVKLFYTIINAVHVLAAHVVVNKNDHLVEHTQPRKVEIQIFEKQAEASEQRQT